MLNSSMKSFVGRRVILTAWEVMKKQMRTRTDESSNACFSLAYMITTERNMNITATACLLILVMPKIEH